MNGLVLFKRFGIDAAVVAAGTGPDGTRNYVAVTIQSSQVPSALTDFPVYVDLSDMPAALFTNVQSDGGDIRVTESDGTTRAPVDLVSIDTGGSTGELHFLASSVSASSNTEYRIYYNASTTLSQPAVGDTNGRNAVWADYEGVWHLHEDPSGTAPQIVDATGNGHDGTTNGSMVGADSVPGKLGGNALDFDGANDYVDMGTSSALDVANNKSFTLSAWAYPHDRSDVRGIAGKVSLDGAVDEYTLLIRVGGGGDAYAGQVRDADVANVQSSASSAAPLNTWTYLVLAGDGSDLVAYMDASAQTSQSMSSITPDTSGDKFGVGTPINHTSGPTGTTGVLPFDGVIDEVRVLNGALSADWVSAEHTNQDTPGTFYSVGSEQAA